MGLFWWNFRIVSFYLQTLDLRMERKKTIIRLKPIAKKINLCQSNSKCIDTGLLRFQLLSVTQYRSYCFDECNYRRIIWPVYRRSSWTTDYSFSDTYSSIIKRRTFSPIPVFVFDCSLVLLNYEADGVEWTKIH